MFVIAKLQLMEIKKNPSIRLDCNINWIWSEFTSLLSIIIIIKIQFLYTNEKKKLKPEFNTKLLFS